MNNNVKSLEEVIENCAFDKAIIAQALKDTGYIHISETKGLKDD